jgi:hypothetical protein
VKRMKAAIAAALLVSALLTAGPAAAGGWSAPAQHVAARAAPLIAHLAWASKAILRYVW